MMNQKEFNSYVAEHLPEHLPDRFSDLHINQQEVFKHNDQMLSGITISSDQETIASPLLYLDHYYEAYQAGHSLDDIMEQIAESAIHSWEQGLDIPAPELIQLMEDYDSVKPHLVPRLCSTSENTERLKNLVHTEFGDYSVTYSVQLPSTLDSDHTMGISIAPSQIDAWGISKETLHQDAMENSQPLLCNIQEMMFSLSFGAPVRNLLEAPDAPDRDESNEMLILSNTEKTYGAAMLAQDGVLQKVADYLGDNFYVLPSSTHEVIILAESALVESALPESPTQNLTLLVQEVNATKVHPLERLSDDVQYFDAQTGVLENAIRREQRIALEKEAARSQADKHTKAQEKKRPSILKKLRDKQSKVKTKAPIPETGKTHSKHKQTSLG